MSRIILHQWEISPFCLKVRKILQYKQLVYVTKNYNGLLALRVSKLSKSAKLPMLKYEGDWIQDSSDIAEFLERRHPQPALFPSDPQQQAQALLWEDWADESLYWYEVYFRFMDQRALQLSIPMLCADRPRFEAWIIGSLAPIIYRQQLRAQGIGRLTRDRVETKFFQHLDRIEVVLSQQPWLASHELTIADIAVAAQLEEILRTSALKNRILAYPKLADWLTRINYSNPV
ncbi:MULTISPECIES: glutathione S-transferase family protein [Trichocoleus]|uniref:Glutathione S-transferase family protein n=1 Tax=Trichocoleus desertorum GB2-A4 TaxID=2933944 RepID=A0ABV0JDW4_9CYAN|nr:glutathione S-transferase family protein [Trichocoleus sp. FACHB-46]MBD1865165.1 glutathione S-transferase family protein [Trichocoleus sp. FACHB-46]